MYKICDFGLGKILKFDTQYITQTILGTPLYVSPQALMTGLYSSKTDIYSVNFFFIIVRINNIFHYLLRILLQSPKLGLIILENNCFG